MNKPISMPENVGPMSSLLRALTGEAGPEKYAQPHHRSIPSMVTDSRGNPVPSLDHLGDDITGSAEMLASLIKIDPLSYLKGSLSTISYGDMMTMARELVALSPSFPLSPEAMAALLYAWATNKKEIADAPTTIPDKRET